MDVTQPYKLLQFIKNISISNDNTLTVDSRYSNYLYNKSSYYLSNSVSNMAKNVQKIVANNQTFTYDYNTTIDGLIPFFESLNKNTSYQFLYQAFQTVILESFAMVYTVENLGTPYIDFTDKDMDRVHNTIDGLINNIYYLSVDGAYDAIIYLRELDSNILYLYSTFGGTNYKISSNFDNTAGRTNLIPNSTFSSVDKFYTLLDGTAVSTVTKVLGDTSPYTLAYIGNASSGVTIRTTPIASFEGSELTLRALSNSPLNVLAVNQDGSLLTSFVDNNGTIVTDSIVTTTNESSPGVQISQGFIIPQGVLYIAIQFTVKQALNTGDDRISELSLSNGSYIGSYIDGVIS